MSFSLSLPLRRRSPGPRLPARLLLRIVHQVHAAAVIGRIEADAPVAFGLRGSLRAAADLQAATSGAHHASGGVHAADGPDGGAVNVGAARTTRMHLRAQPHEEPEHLQKRPAVLRAEQRDGTVIWAEPVRQLPQPDVLPAHPLWHAQGADAVHVPVQVELEQRTG